MRKRGFFLTFSFGALAYVEFASDRGEEVGIFEVRHVGCVRLELADRALDNGVI